MEYLLKAEKVDSKDYIVLGNMAHCYELLEDIKTAIKYYEKVLKLGDEPTKEYARQQLDLLQKK